MWCHYRGPAVYTLWGEVSNPRGYYSLLLAPVNRWDFAERCTVATLIATALQRKSAEKQ